LLDDELFGRVCATYREGLGGREGALVTDLCQRGDLAKTQWFKAKMKELLNLGQCII